MSTFLKNRTSDVPVSRTIHRIEQVLIQCGVSAIQKEYGPTGEVSALTFIIKLDGAEPWCIRLPADIDRAHQALWMQYVDGDKLDETGTRTHWSSQKKKTKANFKAQAEMTAWKIIQDWTEVQMSMISLGQADFRQVFLAYQWNGKESLYDRIKANQFKGLLT